MTQSTAADPLPKGPHSLSRDEVQASQRTRLKGAVTELLAEGGFAAVTIGELARRAGVSRATFYALYDSKEDCLLAAYDDFAARQLQAMSAGVDQRLSWDAFIATTLEAYLASLELDPVAARAFMLEMDSAGDRVRARRREATRGFGTLLALRHAAIRRLDPRLGELPETVYHGLVLGVRELVRERLEEEREPRLTKLAPDVITWITATVEGAAAARERAER